MKIGITIDCPDPDQLATFWERFLTHLDLFVEHAAPMVDEMVAAGATSLATTEAGEWTTRVLQDPAGNEFCVIGPD